jgi:tetratricopeptide (TPR) repeat protein
VIRFRILGVPAHVVGMAVLFCIALAGQVTRSIGLVFTNMGWVVVARDLQRGEDNNFLALAQIVNITDLDSGASAQASVLFDKAVGVDSEQSSALRGLALLSIRTGHPASALDMYQQLQRDSTARVPDYLLAGEIAYLSDQKIQAFRYWEKIGADQYYFGVGRYFAAQINSSAVQNYTLEDRLNLASAAFERVFFINPQRHDALCPAGVVAFLQKDYAEERRLLEAGSAFPELMSADCYVYLGYLRYSSGNISAAIQAFERGGDLGSPTGFLAIGRYYRDLGDCQTAEMWFSRAAALGKFGQPWVELGICALIEKDDVLAERYFLTALDKEPESVAAYYYLGAVALQRGQIDIANERLQTAVRVSNGNYELIPHYSAYLALGDALLQRGDCDQALVQYQIASKIIPNDSKVPVAEAMLSFAEYCEPAK